jgi:penicillin amidase
MLFGRNERVAWGLTNNICAQRDLYQEKESPDKPGQFLFDGEWEQATFIEETIEVKGAEPVVKQIRFSRNGPIVDELLPAPARDTGPVSLRWMGHEPCDEITSMLKLIQAESVSEFREMLRTWIVPTFSFGFADVDGHIGYQASGHLPIKKDWGRGYRPGWDPAQSWYEVIPFDEMPSISDPEMGWIRSANNRTAPKDFPYPLSGVWSSGYRAVRIRNMLERKSKHTRNDIARMQLDTMSLRAVDAVPGLLKILESQDDPRLHEVATLLSSWDCLMEPDRVGASLFEVFFEHWTTEVSAERFSGDSVSLLAGATSGLSTELLSQDAHGWFANGNREASICRAMRDAVDELEGRLGSDMSKWNWGAIHKVALRHNLSERGEIFERLDRGGDPVGGSGITVSNTGFDPNYMAAMGANFRLNVDLAENPPGLWAVDAAGQSGHPGSPNYCDQLPEWQSNRQHYLALDKDRVEKDARHTLILKST